MRKPVVGWGLGAAVFAGALALSSPAAAFCGFYVSGADAKLFNDATQVVLMREGTRTVLSMQNSYKGPPSSFAMVVPVPVVLQKENVKTLPKDIFARVDAMTAPRLVEYWEQDPCQVEAPRRMSKGGMMPPMAAPAPGGAEKKKDLGVTVEAQFTVGEYEVVILSALDAAGLDTWLRQEKYKIPDGAEPYLRPYVQAGSKFFVAKVDAKKVTFDANGVATLSPIRFHYDTDTFSLPVRLGLMNSQGTQDLIVNVFAKGQRYEVANYPNATIPTNFDVAEAARGQFGSFYAALFDRTLEKLPKAVVTEYSWDASSCDPCPSPPLNPSELTTLGADVLPSAQPADMPQAAPPPGAGGAPPPFPQKGGGRPMRRGWFPSGFVVTRMHARYSKDALGEDLVFRAAAPIVGGREVQGAGGKLEHGAASSGQNNFQGRYAIRHLWAGPIACAAPRRGIWGGPPGGGEPKPTPAMNIAFAPRGKLQLATFVKGSLPDVIALPGAPTPLGSPVVQVPASAGGAGGAGGAGAAGALDASLPSTSLDDASTGDAGGTSLPTTPTPTSHACGCDVPGASSPLTTGSMLAGIGLVVAALRRRVAARRR